MDSNDREIRQALDALNGYLRNAGRRDQRAEEASKQLVAATRDGFAQITRAINDGFRMLADVIGSGR